MNANQFYTVIKKKTNNNSQNENKTNKKTEHKKPHKNQKPKIKSKIVFICIKLHSTKSMKRSIKWNNKIEIDHHNSMYW